MEKRKANIIIGKSGGNAGGQYPVTYKVSLPTKWIKEMGINENSKEIDLIFDGEKITITKKQTPYQIIVAARNAGNDVKRLKYYDGDMLCSVIYADYTQETIEVENYTENIVKTAFGNNDIPSWDDYINFLKERCISENRASLQDYLDEIGVAEYDPLEIIRVTKGRMAEDAQWLEVEDSWQ